MFNVTFDANKSVDLLFELVNRYVNNELILVFEISDESSVDLLYIACHCTAYEVRARFHPMNSP